MPFDICLISPVLFAAIVMNSLKFLLCVKLNNIYYFVMCWFVVHSFFSFSFVFMNYCIYFYVFHELLHIFCCVLRTTLTIPCCFGAFSGMLSKFNLFFSYDFYTVFVANAYHFVFWTICQPFCFDVVFDVFVEIFIFFLLLCVVD